MDFGVLLNKNFCVYTVLLGNYELLNEQPVAENSHVDFICFTDNENLTSQSWQIRYIKPLFPFDFTRSSRTLKICTHRFLSDYDMSLYIDNSVVLKKIPETIFNELFEDKDADFICGKHSFRETVLDEFIAVATLQFDNINIITEQFNSYYLTSPDVLKQKPIKTCFLFRKHNNQEVIETMEEWLSHVLRYSRRDQLSFNYVFFEKKLKLHKLDLDFKNSDYFFWPISQGRNIKKYRKRGKALPQLWNEIRFLAKVYFLYRKTVNLKALLKGALRSILRFLRLY